MKTLSVVRHAKAERPEGFPADFDRPLTARGRKDVERLGDLLARLEPPVDHFLSSPATRAAQTTAGLIAVLGYAKDTEWQEEVYTSGPDTLLELLKRAPEEAEHVVLVGHNPVLEELAAGLCTGSHENSVLTLATGTLAHFSLDISRWTQLRWGAGQLKLLVSAKALKRDG